MDKDNKSLISKRQDVKHNEDLGNNYYPSGWQPQASFDESTKTGSITHVQPSNNNFKYDSLLNSWGFDSEEFYIDEDTIRFSTWNAQVKGGEVVDMYAFRAIIKKKNPHHDKYYEKLLREVKKKKPIKVKTGGNCAWFFFMADWQLGKKDLGVDETIKLIRRGIQNGKKQLKDLAKQGFVVKEIYLIGLGDLIENCYGFFKHQTFNVSLTKSEQEHLTRVMILEILDSFLTKAEKIVLGGVPGNHGENRAGKGEVVTNRLDNADTACIQIVGEIIANRPRYKHVQVVVPDDFHLALEVFGKRIAFTHGHMASGGGDIWSKIEKWWKGQMYGWLPAGMSEILVTGHYHHLRVVEQLGRTWFQAPSLDQSDEFKARTGNMTRNGVLSFTVNRDGWDNLKIL
tara:strand:- start:1612 stop:2808 length:1197 start_codon:yes stop_codon:yes gene_type:complete